MSGFVVLFRPTAPPLSEQASDQLRKETDAWANEQNDAGYKLGLHILKSDAVHRGADAPANGDWVSALLFLEASSLAEATHVAKVHPAGRYGFGLEIRPWTRPGVPASER
jgi:hypothetical protein